MSLPPTLLYGAADKVRIAQLAAFREAVAAGNGDAAKLAIRKHDKIAAFVEDMDLLSKVADEVDRLVGETLAA